MSTNLRYTLTLKDLFSRRMNNAIGKTSQLDNKMNRLGNSIKTAMGGLAVGFAVQNIVKTTAEMEGLEIGIKASAKSAEAGERNMKFLNDQVTRLGLDLKGTMQGYQLFNASLIDTSLQGEKGNKVFRQLSEAIAVMHLPAQQANATFLALGQMMSKGTVQAQEMKLQLGNALPGAFQAAARAMGVTTMELNKMMEQGKLVSEDFLPKFGAEMERTFGKKVPAATKSLQANLNRLNTEFTRLKTEVGNEFMPLILKVTKGLIDLSRWTKRNIKDIKMWATLILSLVVALKALKVAQIAANLAMAANPIGLVITALAGLALAIKAVWEWNKKLRNDYTQSIEDRKAAAIVEETTRLNELAAAYEKMGLSRRKAREKAFTGELLNLKAKIGALELNLGKGTPEQRLATAQRLTEETAKLGVLTGKNIFSDPSKAGGASGSLKGKSKLGTGTEGHGARPQNLNITIDKLVETLKIEAATVREGTVQMKEMVSKVLIEAVNDINTAAK